MPVYFRTLEELLAPLQREDSPVHGAFAVGRAEALEAPVPFLVEFRRGGDVSADGQDMHSDASPFPMSGCSMQSQLAHCKAVRNSEQRVGSTSIPVEKPNTPALSSSGFRTVLRLHILSLPLWQCIA